MSMIMICPGCGANVIEGEYVSSVVNGLGFFRANTMIRHVGPICGQACVDFVEAYGREIQEIMTDVVRRIAKSYQEEPRIESPAKPFPAKSRSSSGCEGRYPLYRRLTYFD